MDEKTYVVATIRPWNVAQFHKTVSKLPGNWELIENPEELTLERLAEIKPRYIFFPHWSHRVPAEIITRYECVCFHETDVPYGRGGSPIQNLLERGHRDTMVTALRMVEIMDGGPVYAKSPLSLLGLAEEIFLRAAEVVAAMIAQIVKDEPAPVEQTGEPTIFKRRTPAQSRIAHDVPSLDALFDHLRMLDADEYPHAFLEYGQFRLEFSRPALRTGSIEATVRITPNQDESAS